MYIFRGGTVAPLPLEYRDGFLFLHDYSLALIKNNPGIVWSQEEEGDSISVHALRNIAHRPCIKPPTKKTRKKPHNHLPSTNWYQKKHKPTPN